MSIWVIELQALGKWIPASLYLTEEQALYLTEEQASASIVEASGRSPGVWFRIVEYVRKDGDGK